MDETKEGFNKDANQRPKDWDLLYETRRRVIQSIAKNMDLFGITPSVGRLYGTMFFHNQPMTLDDMGDELGMSKTSMSTGVRSLQEIHMVRQTWRKGVRKDLYTAEEDWYKTFVELFTIKWRQAIEVNSNEIEDARKKLHQLLRRTADNELKMTLEEDLAKLQHASEYYEWLSRLVESFESGEIFELIPKRPQTHGE